MVEQIKKVMVGTGDGRDFVRRSVFSSEFLLVLLYIAGLYANGAFNLGISDAAMSRIENIVFLWTGIRQVGKAVTYKIDENKNGGGTQ